jgi:AcrR family transcriptional regulator
MSAMNPTSWKGIPADERSARRRRQLLDAGFELLGTEGLAAAGVRAVCRRAELTSRYFYESFADVDELHAAVFDETAAAVIDELRAAIDAAPPDHPARARATVETALDAITRDPRRARILLVEAHGSEILALRRRALLRAFAAIAREQLVGIAQQPGPLLADAAADLLAAGLFDVLLAWSAGQLAHTREQLVDDATDLLIVNTIGVTELMRRRTAAPSR